tara:strand:- start:116 stop:502 length:387 start_codon:yes stop_codon:yes gene_type:complete
MMSFQNNNKIKFILVFLIFLQLFYIANKRLDFETEIFKKSFLKDFGSEYVMTSDILELKKITNDLKLEKFNISKKLTENVFFFQRSIEFLYPIKIDKKSKNIFFSSEEVIPNNCNILNQYEHLNHVKC